MKAVARLVYLWMRSHINTPNQNELTTELLLRTATCLPLAFYLTFVAAMVQDHFLPDNRP